MVGMLLVGLGLGQLMQTLTLASPELGRPAGHRRRDELVDLLPPDRWNARRRDPVLGAVQPHPGDDRAPRSRTRTNLAEPAAAAADPDGARRSGEREDPRTACRAARTAAGASLGDSLNGDTSFLNNADPRLAAPFLEGFDNATVTIYWVAPRGGAGRVRAELLPQGGAAAAKSALQENADNEAALAAQLAATAAAPLVAEAPLNEPAGERRASSARP